MLFEASGRRESYQRVTRANVTPQPGAQLVTAQNGCHVYDVLAACPQSCLEWLKNTDTTVLNPEARPSGPRRLPPGKCR